MKLECLIQDINVRERVHWDNKEIQRVTSDSRAVEPGDIFVAYPGARMNGHDFLNQAIVAGASAIVYEKLPQDFTIPQKTTGIQVENSQQALALLLLRMHGNPDKHVKLVSVTGTNGKTTVSYLLHHLLKQEISAAYLGTLWYELPTKRIEALNTTPGPEILVPLLESMRDARVDSCIMEVSSHALDQNRVYGLEFELAMFTQLSQDHLDYHHDLENYFQSKRKLFLEPEPRKKLINFDCPYGRRLLAELPSAKSYSLENPGADYFADNIETSFKGSEFIFCYEGGRIPVKTNLAMRHNVANVLCVLAAVCELGHDPRLFVEALSKFMGIPGRLERVSEKSEFDVFVDYAHTPDAFENVLAETARLAPKKVLTLFGCGGDRDRDKRHRMTEAACRYSDFVVLTTDNPRSEDPEVIMTDMKRGIGKSRKDGCKVIEVLDRAQAINTLIDHAEPGDVVLILGKGHEDYQILGDRKIPFDDRQVAREAIKRKARVFYS